MAGSIWAGPQAAYWSAALVIFAGSAIRGGWPARVAATLILANFIVSNLGQHIYAFGILPILTVADAGLAAGLVILAHRTSLWWTRAVAGFGVLLPLSHVGALLDWGIWTMAYIAMQWVISGLVLLALLASVLEQPVARKHETRPEARS